MTLVCIVFGSVSCKVLKLQNGLEFNPFIYFLFWFTDLFFRNVFRVNVYSLFTCQFFFMLQILSLDKIEFRDLQIIIVTKGFLFHDLRSSLFTRNLNLKIVSVKDNIRETSWGKVQITSTMRKCRIFVRIEHVHKHCLSTWNWKHWKYWKHWKHWSIGGRKARSQTADLLLNPCDRRFISVDYRIIRIVRAETELGLRFGILIVSTTAKSSCDYYLIGNLALVQQNKWQVWRN